VYLYGARQETLLQFRAILCVLSFTSRKLFLIIKCVLVMVAKMTCFDICYKFGFPLHLPALVTQCEACCCGCCLNVVPQRERHWVSEETNTAIVSFTSKRNFKSVYRYVIDFCSCKKVFLYYFRLFKMLTL
jgi:hypothetical protein